MGPTYKRITLCFFSAISINAAAATLPANNNYAQQSLNPSVTNYVTELSPLQKEKITTYSGIITNHLNKNFSIIRTVRILTKHSPQDVTSILVAAYQQQPEHITAISRAVIRSEPALTNDVVATALTVAPERCDEIVAMAINAEPGYIDDIVATAVNHKPEKLDSIVRIAITAEPDLSGSVVRSAAETSPNNFFGAVLNSIKSLPKSTKNVYYAVKDFFIEQNTSRQTDLPETTPEHWQQFIERAKQSGVTREELEWFKEKGYISEQQLTTAFNQ